MWLAHGRLYRGHIQAALHCVILHVEAGEMKVLARMGRSKKTYPYRYRYLLGLLHRLFSMHAFMFFLPQLPLVLENVPLILWSVQAQPMPGMAVKAVPSLSVGGSR